MYLFIYLFIYANLFLLSQFLIYDILICRWRTKASGHGKSTLKRLDYALSSVKY